MAAFTEMGPGAQLHYLMAAEQQNAAHQAHQAYSFIYGAPPQLVPYQQQQQQQQQQQPQAQHPPQRSRNGQGLPPTPPGSPRPQHQQQNQQPLQSAIKQQPTANFASPVRTQHPSQPQSLPLYPQPSPLHPTMQNLNGGQNDFIKQQQQQQQLFQWPVPQQQQQQQQTNPVPTGMYGGEAAFPIVPSSTSPSLVHALSQAGQSRRSRSEKKPVPDDVKDDKYYERRKRNNVAAKKSRDSRKAREDEISIRASFLEKENAILRAQVATLRDEANSLKQLLLQKQVTTSSAPSASLGPRPAATSTPNAKQQGFNMAQSQQPSQLAQAHSNNNQNSLALAAQQAALYAAAFVNQHHHQVLGQSENGANQQQQQQNNQEVIHSAA